MGLLLISLSLFNVARAGGEEPYSDQQLLSASDAYRAIHPSELTILSQVAPKSIPGDEGREDRSTVTRGAGAAAG